MASSDRMRNLVVVRSAALMRHQIWVMTQTVPTTPMSCAVVHKIVVLFLRASASKSGIHSPVPSSRMTGGVLNKLMTSDKREYRSGVCKPWKHVHNNAIPYAPASGLLSASIFLMGTDGAGSALCAAPFPSFSLPLPTLSALVCLDHGLCSVCHDFRLVARSSAADGLAGWLPDEAAPSTSAAVSCALARPAYKESSLAMSSLCVPCSTNPPFCMT
mmetsp:Transcript_78905/g.198281  ORF Transcript_78905/g.198281 Transcript_78905/m.198281 type:complete len:216 (-) Transcript_78905:564-1211(-)